MTKKQILKLSDQIRKAVDIAKDSGLSRYAICKAAEIDQASFSRFMNGKTGLQMSKLDAVADVLELELKPIKRAKTKGK